VNYNQSNSNVRFAFFFFFICEMGRDSPLGKSAPMGPVIQAPDGGGNEYRAVGEIRIGRGTEVLRDNLYLAVAVGRRQLTS
jgi:hypothetical protein